MVPNVGLTVGPDPRTANLNILRRITDCTAYGRRMADFMGRHRSAALLLYFPLAGVLLPALVGHLFRDVATGDGMGDGYQNLWNLWWVGRALARGHGIYDTDLLSWPQHTSLVFHTLSPASGLLSLPLRFLIPGVPGLVASLNLLTLASFALTGIAAHLIARDHGASELGASTAGFLAMSLPYRFLHLNQINLLSTHWTLFTLLFFDRALTRRAFKPALAAALCAALTTYSDYECAVYAALAALVLLAFRTATVESRRALVRTYGVLASCVGVALILHLPLARALLAQRGNPAMMPSPEDAEHLSANLLGVVLPAPISLLQQGWSTGYLPRGHGLAGDEVSLGMVFIGAVIVLAVRRSSRAIWPWMTLGAMFLVLALGPSLQVGSVKLLSDAMPYAWLVKAVPFLAMGRCPVRMGNMAGIFFSIALGLMIGQPTDRATRAGWRDALSWDCGLLLLLVLERYPRTAPAMEEVRVPAAYEKLAADPAPFAIMPTPTPYYHQQVYMFWQTVHGKPMTSGGGARHGASDGTWLAAFWRTPPEGRLALLQAAHIRYIFEHPRAPDRLLREDPRVIEVPTRCCSSVE